MMVGNKEQVEAHPEIARCFDEYTLKNMKLMTPNLPRGMGVMTKKQALDVADILGYPVLLRPSYVIGGQNMKIVHNSEETSLYMDRILSSGIENPIRRRVRPLPLGKDIPCAV